MKDQVDYGREVFLSFLPLSHAYEHMAGQFVAISMGAQIYYAESADKLVANMAEVRPTIMTAVPRLYEAIHSRIARQMAREGGLRKTLFDKAIELGKKRYEQPGTLSLWDRICDSLLDLVIRRKVANRFGVGSSSSCRAARPSITTLVCSSPRSVSVCSRAMAKPRPRR